MATKHRITVAEELRFDSDVQGLRNLSGTYAGLSAWFGRNIKPSSQVFQVMASPPTIAALATATGITSPRSCNATNPGGTIFRDDFWRYLGASRPKVFPTSNAYVVFDSFTLPSGNAVGHYSVEFYHYGTQVEFKFYGNAGNYQILVDDQLVQAAPFVTTNTGSNYFQLITFGTAAVRKIRFRGYNVAFGGVNIGTTDQIWPSEKRGPRVVVLGDSFTNGTGSTGGPLTSWASYLAETMGWYDVYHMYAGGSGYTVAGSGTTFASRVANGVIANAPDIVIHAGGHNDDGVATSAALGTAASSLLAAVKAGLPNVQQIVASQFWARGPANWPSGIFDNRAALKAAATAASAPFLDVLEVPITRTPASGTLAAQANAAATSFTTSGPRPIIGSLVHIGSTANGSGWDRARVTNVTGGGPFTVTLNVALNNTQASGAAWTEVGECWSDGSGYVTATTGAGPSDVFCASDFTHPSDAGHSALGRFIAGQFANVALHY
jgi:lysophospholipase L1-like esterase